MSRQFLFMRHGESTANIEGICAGGETLHPLTGAGRIQAGEAAEILRLNGILPDRIVHSHQPRADETAQVVADRLSISPDRVTGDTNWRERGFGEWEGVLFVDIYHHLKAWTDPPGGEKLPVLFERVAMALAALPDGLNLVVSHGGLWHVLNRLHGVHEAEHIGNAEIFRVAIRDGAIQSERIV